MSETTTKGASYAPINFFSLDKVFSTNKQAQIIDILQHFNPTHAERLWLCGFLKYTGYSYEETVNIIDKHCQWTDYDSGITAYQVATVFKQPHKRYNNTNCCSKCCKRKPRKWDLTPLQAHRIQCARTTETNRTLDAFLHAAGKPIFDSLPNVAFDGRKVGGFEK